MYPVQEQNKYFFFGDTLNAQIWRSIARSEAACGNAWSDDTRSLPNVDSSVHAGRQALRTAETTVRKSVTRTRRLNAPTTTDWATVRERAGRRSHHGFDKFERSFHNSTRALDAASPLAEPRRMKTRRLRY